jgi:phosphatidylglycerophosphate synthase
MLPIDALRLAICVTLLCAAAASELCTELGLAYLPAAALPVSLFVLLPIRALLSTWPNVVTLLRFAVAATCVLYPVESGSVRCLAGLLFVLLDFADGALARRLNQASAVGSLLDEEADAFGTLVASAELIRLGMAPRWLAVHQGCAHYLFVVLMRALCPGFEWHMPFVRTAEGIMGVCLVGASIAHAAHAPGWLSYSMGLAGCSINAASFGLSYALMAREVLRRRLAAAPRFVLATVGPLHSTCGGYIFERLMYEGLSRSCASSIRNRPLWKLEPELWELAYEHEIFISRAALTNPTEHEIFISRAALTNPTNRTAYSPLTNPTNRTAYSPPPTSPRGSDGRSLISREEAAARFGALPPGSVVVMDGLALLQVLAF